MPVFNIAQPKELNLTPIIPKSYSIVNNEFVQLDNAATEPTELLFGETHYTGDIVNTGSPEDRGVFFIFPSSATSNPPTKSDVRNLGIPVYPGGSSYHIPEGCKLRFFVACTGVDAELSAQYLG
jgi:hypothetical protein